MAKTRTIKFVQCIKWFVLTDILLTNRDEPNLILPQFARALYLFLALTEINIVR